MDRRRNIKVKQRKKKSIKKRKYKHEHKVEKTSNDISENGVAALTTVKDQGI